jgi:drug/metabolite transporter (DMT)-like permease
MQKEKITGHIFTFITITIWSVAFVSNKALLAYISPIENMILRFLIAYILLLIIYPKQQLPSSFVDESKFFILGFLGIFIYFLLENFALQFTQATNVGLYMSAIPLFTAIFAHFFTKDEKLSRNVVIGFLIAIVGIALILLDGASFQLRLKGDLLALSAAVVFALYSVALKLAPKGYHYIVITRKSFFYGLLLMVIYFLISGKSFHYHSLAITTVWLNILFLGLISSGLAFVLWQQGIERIGSINASNYIYLVPLITAIAGIIALDEKLTFKMILGGITILIGLYIAQKRK